MIDYDQITIDMAASIRTASLGFKKVIEDAGDTDFVFENCPLADVRFKRAIVQSTGQRNTWTDVIMEVEIGAYDVTNRRASAKIRNDLIQALQRHFQVNPRFSASVDTTMVGNVEAESVEDDKQGAFIASAVCEFHVMVYTEG